MKTPESPGHAAVEGSGVVVLYGCPTWERYPPSGATDFAVELIYLRARGTLSCGNGTSIYLERFSSKRQRKVQCDLSTRKWPGRSSIEIEPHLPLRYAVTIMLGMSLEHLDLSLTVQVRWQ
jgi:hypothetical protein